MGRRFTSASNERISITTAAGLAGFDWRYGTIACTVNVVSSPGIDAVWFCLSSSGAVFQPYLDSANDSNIWNGSVDTSAAGVTLTAGTTHTFSITKATGSVAARAHRYVHNTNTWTHAAFGSAQADAAATVDMTLGNDPTFAEPFNAEFWHFAVWSGLAMSDTEVERLAKTPDWRRLAPDFFVQWTDGRNTGDMLQTLGRYQVRQTARTGTSAGTATAPFGPKSSPVARRR